ncbi:MAG: PEP-CTERM sorting domain-containing protein [Akkermansia sp.]|nr:PEP-CTERM sorting domain-containing protein [Akkermansia sp.]
MKKSLIALLALAGMAMADTTLLDIDFTTLTGSTNDNTPAGWTAGQWNGTGNTPYYNFGTNGATVGQPWKQNYLTTNLDIASQGEYSISFTLYNSGEDTGNMFFLSSESYSIVMGNSYNSNSEIYVGTLTEAVGSDYVCFQTGTKINPTVLANSDGLNVSGDITYTLTMLGGDMTIAATLSNGGTWSTTITGMEDVTFDKIGFMNDGAPGTSGVKGITITTPETPAVPEPTTATLSLLALAGLAARRRRK